MKNLLLIIAIVFVIGCSKEESTSPTACKLCTELTKSNTSGTTTTSVVKFTACGQNLLEVDGKTETTHTGGYSIQFGNQPYTTTTKTTTCQ